MRRFFLRTANPRPIETPIRLTATLSDGKHCFRANAIVEKVHAAGEGPVRDSGMTLWLARMDDPGRELVAWMGGQPPPLLKQPAAPAAAVLAGGDTGETASDCLRSPATHRARRADVADRRCEHVAGRASAAIELVRRVPSSCSSTAAAPDAGARRGADAVAAARRRVRRASQRTPHEAVWSDHRDRSRHHQLVRRRGQGRQAVRDPVARGLQHHSLGGGPQRQGQAHGRAPGAESAPDQPEEHRVRGEAPDRAPVQVPGGHRSARPLQLRDRLRAARRSRGEDGRTDLLAAEDLLAGVGGSEGRGGALARQGDLARGDHRSRVLQRG